MSQMSPTTVTMSNQATIDINSTVATFNNKSSQSSPSVTMSKSSSSFTLPGIRYLILFLVSTGCFFACFTRVNLNIALVAMTKSPNSSSTSPSSPSSSSSPASAVTTYDWNQNIQGSILGSFFWTYMAFQVPAGVLVEKFGGKWIVSIALITSTMLNFLTPTLADHLVLLIASRMLLGILQAGVFSGSFAIVTNWMPLYQRSFSYSFLRVGAIIGTIAINILTGHLCVNFGWPSAFYVPGLIASVFTLIFVLLMKNHPSDYKCITDAELKLITTNNPKRIEPKLSQIPWQLIFTNRPVLTAGFLKFSYFWLFFTIQTKLPTYLDTVMKMDLKSNGNINGMFNLFNGISLTVTGYLSDQIIHRKFLTRIQTRKTMTFIAIFGSGLLVALIPSISSQSGILTLLYSSAFLLGFSSGGDVPLPAEMSPNMPATIFALINGLCMISGFAAPQFAGFVLDSLVLGSLEDRWSIIFYTSFAICTFATILFMFFASCERQLFDFVVVGEEKKEKVNQQQKQQLNQSKDMDS